MRLLLVLLLSLSACDAPATVVPSPTATATPFPTPATPPPTPGPQRYSLLYGEFLGPRQPLAVRGVSLNTRAVREVARIAPEHDGRFAIHPDGRRMAILDKLDHHVPRTTTWRLRLLDLDTLSERDVIAERTDPEPIIPWDVGWTPGGTLLLVSRPSLDRVDERDGTRAPLARFADGTLGVTFRDLVHPTIVVSQTADAYSVYLVSDDAVRKVAERELVGIASYARRPGTDEIVELVTRFDGAVTYSVLRRDGTESRFTLEGPRVEGLVELIGTTPEAAYILWPIEETDPLALGVVGSALLYRLGYDGDLTVVDGARNWGPFGPLGVSPDGRALLVPNGNEARSDARFTISVCCERRPAPLLLDYGDRFVIGWLPER